jgi:hypothetical protein
MKYAANEFAKACLSLEPKSLSAATTNGTGVDCKDFDEALIVAMYGVAAANAESDITVEESDDNSSFTAITGAAFTQVVTAGDQVLRTGRVDLRKHKRYLRMVNSGDGSNAVLVAGAIVLMSPKTGPASAETANDFSV